MGCVYLHKNKITGEPYIGCSYLNYCNVAKGRWGSNGIGYYKQPYFGSAIKKYGWENFEHICLEDNIPRDLVAEREIYYIAKYHTYIYDSNYICGYNLTPGGDKRLGSWEPWEIRLVEQNFKGVGASGCQVLIDAEWLKFLPDSLKPGEHHRSIKSIKAFASRYIDDYYGNNIPYSKEECSIINETYEKENGPQICHELMPNRTLKNIMAKAVSMGKKACSQKPSYSEQENALLRANHNKPIETLQLLLPNRSALSIKRQLVKLGYKKDKYKKVLCIDTNVIYESVIAAAAAYSVSKSSIRQCLNGYSKTAADHHWKYIE